MAGSDRLEGRRLLGHGRRRRGQLALVGAAVLALAAAGRASQEVPDLARFLNAEWKARLETLRAAGPDDGEAAIADLHAWYATRSEQLERAKQNMGYFAFDLAQNAEWTPDVERQVAYWKDLVDALESMGYPDKALERASTPANLLLKAGRFEETAEYTEELLERFAEVEVNRDNHLVRLAEARRETGDYAGALDALERFEQLEPPSTDEALRVRMLLIRAMTYADLGVPDSAVVYVTEGLRLAEDRFAEGTGPPNEVTTARRTSLLVDLARADHASVAERVEAYLEDPLYRRHPVERRQLEVFLGTSLLRSKHGDPLQSERGIELLRRAVEAGLPSEFEGHARLEIVREMLERGTPDLARHELDAVHALVAARSGPRALVQVAADVAMLEVRMALDRGAPREELESLEGPLVKAVEDLVGVWAQVPERSGGVGFLLYSQRRNAVAERIRLMRALEPESGDEIALSYLMRLQALGTLARREDAPEPSLEEIRETLLADDHGLLMYLPAEERTYAFAIDRQGLLLTELGRGGQIGGARYRYIRHLMSVADVSGPEADLLVREERQLAAGLADALFDDRLRERIAGWKRITISGTDVLGPLPIEWLPLGSEPYLGIGRDVAYLPSIPLGVSRARERRPQPDWELLLVAATQPGPAVRERWPEAVELPFSEVDRRGLLAAYDPGRSRALVGPEATFRSLARFDLARLQVLQFLGHAVRDPSRERPVALVAAPDDVVKDGLVWCEGVEELPAPALVLLTACRSGLGRQRRGDPGTTDMGGAWIAQGARAVVVASKDLVYGDAVSASNTIHEHLVAGNSPAAALRALRERAVDEHRDRAPLLGGLLHVVGLGHEPIFERPAGAGGRGGDGRVDRLPLLVAGGLLVLVAFAIGVRVGARLPRR